MREDFRELIASAEEELRLARDFGTWLFRGFMLPCTAVR